jgi:hypothetical protein
MTLEDWKKLSAKSQIQFSGTLSIGEKSYPLTTTARKVEKAMTSNSTA